MTYFEVPDGQQKLRKKCSKKKLKRKALQVNLFQIHLFLNKLTHNMTADCSFIPEFSTRKIQAENMLCTNIVLKTKTKTKNNVCTQHVLKLYFSCTEVRNQ